MNRPPRNLIARSNYSDCGPHSSQQKRSYHPFQNKLTTSRSSNNKQRAFRLLLGGGTGPCRFCRANNRKCTGEGPHKRTCGGRICQYKNPSTASMSPLVSQDDIRLLLGGGTGPCRFCRANNRKCTGEGPHKRTCGGRICQYKNPSTASMSPLVSQDDIRLLLGTPFWSSYFCVETAAVIRDFHLPSWTYHPRKFGCQFPLLSPYPDYSICMR